MLYSFLFLQVHLFSAMRKGPELRSTSLYLDLPRFACVSGHGETALHVGVRVGATCRRRRAALGALTSGTRGRPRHNVKHAAIHVTYNTSHSSFTVSSQIILSVKIV